MSFYTIASDHNRNNLSHITVKDDDKYWNRMVGKNIEMNRLLLAAGQIQLYIAVFRASCQS